MARQEHDREDLLREATALVERAELQIPSWNESIVAGFRRDGSFSVYFGGDPVYQFNSAGELRRAFVDGLMYKAEQGQLASLRREQEAGHTTLIRQQLSGDEQTALLTSAQHALEELRMALQQHRFAVVGQIPTESNVAQHILRWLVQLPVSLPIASRPNVS